MKNKKKLLVTVGVMGLMAIATGGVGTAAWFQSTMAGKVIKNTDGNADVSVVDPQITANAVNLPIKVVGSRVSNKSLVLATWLTAAPTGTSAIKTGETFTDAGLWTAAANGVTPAQGYTYTQGIDGNTYEMYAVCKITITAPDNHLDSSGNETDSSPIYAYWDSTNGVGYSKSDIETMMANEKVDIKLERDGTNSRAKFYGVSETNNVGAPTAAGEQPLTANNSNNGYSISGIASGVDIFFGLYVEGENSSIDSTTSNTPNGDFKVTVITHGGSF